MEYDKTIIVTFIITSLWDIILRYMSINYEQLPLIIKRFIPFIKYLKPYFKIHTLLAAALIAGFVGAVSQSLILLIMPVSDALENINNIIIFFVITFIVSALYGFIIKASNLFPYLEKYYYNKLGIIRSMYHDGISGLIVQLTLIIILLIKQNILKLI